MPEIPQSAEGGSSAKYAAALPFFGAMVFLWLDRVAGPAGNPVQALVTLSAFIFLPAFAVVAAFLVARQEPGGRSRNLFRLTSIAYGLVFLLNLLFGILLLSSSDSPHLGVAAPTFYFGILYLIFLIGSAGISASLLLLWSNRLPADPRDSWLVTELRDRAPMYHGLLSSAVFLVVLLFLQNKFVASDGGVRAFLGLGTNLLIPLFLLVPVYVSAERNAGAPAPLLHVTGNARTGFWLIAVVFLFFTLFDVWFSILMFRSEKGAGYSGIWSPYYSDF